MAPELVHPLVADYLQRLERATLDLPWTQRRQLLERVEEQLARKLGRAPADADVTAALDRFGPPEELVNAERRPRPAWWLRWRRGRRGD